MASELIDVETIAGLAELSHAAARKNGWWDQERNLGEMIALVHSELAEFRAVMSSPEPILDDHLPGRYNMDVELADIFIRLGDMFAGYGHLLFNEGHGYDSPACIAIFLQPQESLERQLVDNLSLLHTPHAEGVALVQLCLQAEKELPPKGKFDSLPMIYDFTVQQIGKTFSSATADSCLLYMHSLLSRTLERQRKRFDFSVVSLDLFMLLTAVDVLQEKFLRADDFAALVHQKIEYNASRGKKHGKSF